MTRKPRQSLNSSLHLNNTITTNTSMHDTDLDGQQEFEYKEFVKRFGRFDLEQTLNVNVIGYKKNIDLLSEKIATLIGIRPENEVEEERLSGGEVQTKYKQDFILLTGPSGTGKTTVFRHVFGKFVDTKNKNACQIALFYLKASWILEKQFGNPEVRLRMIFDEAVKKQPSLIFIDNIDLLCSERKSMNDTRERIFFVLEDKLEYIRSLSAKLLVVAATNRPEILDPQLLKPSFFSDEIYFRLPNRVERMDYLRYEIYRIQGNYIDRADLYDIADNCHCYTFEDLRKLIEVTIKLPPDSSNRITYDSLRSTLKKFKPVAIKSITTPCPKLYWSDIGGVDNVKRILIESVIWPIKHKDKFIKLGITPNKGALLYGPPGCSKTMLAQALATESGYNFISVKGPELFSKYVGDSEAAVRRLYKRAREVAPCIIFFDEIDGFATERSESNSSSTADKVVAQLLTELNGVEPLENVFTIAATNRPDRVDQALLRPGRLDPSIYIPLPNETDRREIFKVCLRNRDIKGGTRDEVSQKLALLTDGYSGAEIDKICQFAGIVALRESLENESREFKHLTQALEIVKPGTSINSLKIYEKFQQRTSSDFNAAAGPYKTSQDSGQRFAATADKTGLHQQQAAGEARLQRFPGPCWRSLLARSLRRQRRYHSTGSLASNE